VTNPWALQFPMALAAATDGSNDSNGSKDADYSYDTNDAKLYEY
jgi:hypothetical protein